MTHPSSSSQTFLKELGKKLWTAADRHVGVEEQEEDGELCNENMARPGAALDAQPAKSAQREAAISENLKRSRPAT